MIRNTRSLRNLAWTLILAGLFVVQGIFIIQSERLAKADPSSNQAGNSASNKSWKLEQVVIKLDTVQSMFNTKQWAQSITAETRIEKWEPGQMFRSKVAEIGSPSFYYNAFYEKEQCQQPFCGVSSISYHFPDANSASRLSELIIASDQNELENAFLVSLGTAPTALNCVEGEQGVIMQIRCTEAVKQHVNEVQIVGLTPVSTEMEDAALHLIQLMHQNADKVVEN